MTCDRSMSSSTNKGDRHYITEILLKVALSTINQTKPNLTFVFTSSWHRYKYKTIVFWVTVIRGKPTKLSNVLYTLVRHMTSQNYVQINWIHFFLQKNRCLRTDCGFTYFLETTELNASKEWLQNVIEQRIMCDYFIRTGIH